MNESRRRRRPAVSPKLNKSRLLANRRYRWIVFTCEYFMNASFIIDENGEKYRDKRERLTKVRLRGVLEIALQRRTKEIYCGNSWCRPICTLCSRVCISTDRKVFGVGKGVWEFSWRWSSKFWLFSFAVALTENFFLKKRSMSVNKRVRRRNVEYRNVKNP